ncbi:hypothetical protein [Humisphaera borealis]|uniref:Uncharacterized protein n=1 Tax=Humisphaera borealis TaxID=2807512 RepID=A0A7M2WQ91_9BACT|nr:hypothetical protein [Humisphaera borealis]QOV87616.1 hypothetical protein IPV69_15110 [Humisphaera borealis]
MFKEIDGLMSFHDPERDAVRSALGHYEPVRALNIRQRHAEPQWPTVAGVVAGKLTDPVGVPQLNQATFNDAAFTFGFVRGQV